MNVLFVRRGIPSKSICRFAMKQLSRNSLVRGLVAVVLLVSILGCGQDAPKGPPLVQVSGIVTLNGKPLATGGTVSYRDSGGIIQPSGKVGSDGHYELFTDKRPGAPVGNYRVLVFASESPEQAAVHGGLPRLIVHKKFMDLTTTPLHREVKDGNSSGAYDLQVTGIN